MRTTDGSARWTSAVSDRVVTSPRQSHRSDAASSHPLNAHSSRLSGVRRLPLKVASTGIPDGSSFEVSQGTSYIRGDRGVIIPSYHFPTSCILHILAPALNPTTVRVRTPWISELMYNLIFEKIDIEDTDHEHRLE